MAVKKNDLSRSEFGGMLPCSCLFCTISSLHQFSSYLPFFSNLFRCLTALRNFCENQGGIYTIYQYSKGNNPSWEISMEYICNRSQQVWDVGRVTVPVISWCRRVLLTAWGRNSNGLLFSCINIYIAPKPRLVGVKIAPSILETMKLFVLWHFNWVVGKWIYKETSFRVPVVLAPIISRSSKLESFRSRHRLASMWLCTYTINPPQCLVCLWCLKML